MRKDIYPPQQGAYKVQVKSEQSTHRWSNFNLARLQISVGQDFHEGEKLEALIEWCKPRFESVQVCVNDTLQRFNMMFERNISSDEAYACAENKGQEWLDRCISTFSELPHLEIKRWDSWKRTPLFEGYKNKIEKLYHRNHEFRQIINENIDSIWERRVKVKPECYCESRHGVFISLARSYLLEEIAAFSVMFEMGEGIDIYPGSTIFAAIAFQGRTVEGAPSGLGKGHFCRIDFTRNKAVNSESPLKLIKGSSRD